MRNNDQQDSSRKNETNNQLWGFMCHLCSMWVLLDEYNSHMDDHDNGPRHCSSYVGPSLSSSYGFPLTSTTCCYNYDESASLATNMENSTVNGGWRFQVGSTDDVSRSKRPKTENDEQCILSLQCPNSNNKQKSIDQHANSSKGAKHPQYNGDKIRPSRDSASSNHTIETQCTTKSLPLSVIGGESSKSYWGDLDLNSWEPCTRRLDPNPNLAVSGECGEQARMLFIRRPGIDLNKAESSEGEEQSPRSLKRRLDFDLNEAEANDSGEVAPEPIRRGLDIDLNEVELDESGEGNKPT